MLTFSEHREMDAKPEQENMDDRPAEMEPDDELYNALFLPDYCWPIIRTPEFQRLRSILQLGTTHYVYQGATHTRFEHSLGVAHLANMFMENIREHTPGVENKHCQAVVLAGLCHDLGHGPWSHLFERFLADSDVTKHHEDWSVEIMNRIINRPGNQHTIDDEVVQAAACFIRGKPYGDWPKWLAHIVADKEHDIDLDKFDYIDRDTLRCLGWGRFEYGRLIMNCRIIDDEIAWKMSDMTVIDRMFYSRNDLFRRVYYHRVSSAIDLMIWDMLKFADKKLEITKKLNSANQEEALNEYLKLDDRLLYIIERGDGGEEAKEIALRIAKRDLYRYVGSVGVNSGQRNLKENGSGESPEKDEAEAIEEKHRIQKQEEEKNELVAEIEATDPNLEGKLRVCTYHYRYGLHEAHPLLKCRFWKSDGNHVVKIDAADFSSFIVPVHFVRTSMSVYITDNNDKLVNSATIAFNQWKDKKEGKA